MYKYGLATGETTRHRHPLSHAVKRGEANTHAVTPVAARGAARERDRPVADILPAVTSVHTAAASVRPVADARPVGHAVTGRHAQHVIRRQKRASVTSLLRRRRRSARNLRRPSNVSKSICASRTTPATTRVSSQILVSARTPCRLVAQFVTSSVRRAQSFKRR